MPRRMRDLIGSILGLAILGVALVAVNEPLRQSFERWSGNVSDIRSIGPIAGLSSTVAGAFAVVSSFSVDNTLMVAFMVVATVLVVLMLKV